MANRECIEKKNHWYIHCLSRIFMKGVRTPIVKILNIVDVYYYEFHNEIKKMKFLMFSKTN